MRLSSRIGRTLGRVVPSAALVSCSALLEPCIRRPCITPIAVRVLISGDQPNVLVNDVFVRAGVGDAKEASPCVEQLGACMVMGDPGTYVLEIGAPGFQTINRTVVVPGETPSCGCAIAQTQVVGVALVPVR